MAVRQHDGKTEAEELSKTLAALHGQLDIKDRNIATLLESNKAKVRPPPRPSHVASITDRVPCVPCVSCRVCVCRAVPCRAVPCRAVPCRAVWRAQEFLLEELNDRLKEVAKQMNELEESLTTNKKELEDFRNLEQTLELLRQESEQTKKALEEKIAELTASKQRMLALSDFKVNFLRACVCGGACACAVVCAWVAHLVPH
jgi:DNA repair exonuclease SbcCD ATPase subunit